MGKQLIEIKNPYFKPYGYRDAIKVLNGTAPLYYYHLKEIEMDKGDGIRLANYAKKKGLDIRVHPDSDPDYPEYYIPGEYHWDDYFYPYPLEYDDSKINKDNIDIMMNETYYDEEKPFTFTQVRDELKRETNNWETKEDTIRYFYEEERHFAMEVLSHHYECEYKGTDEDGWHIIHFWKEDLTEDMRNKLVESNQFVKDEFSSITKFEDFENWVKDLVASTYWSSAKTTWGLENQLTFQVGKPVSSFKVNTSEYEWKEMLERNKRHLSQLTDRLQEVNKELQVELFGKASDSLGLTNINYSMYQNEVSVPYNNDILNKIIQDNKTSLGYQDRFDVAEGTVVDEEKLKKLKSEVVACIQRQENVATYKKYDYIYVTSSKCYSSTYSNKYSVEVRLAYTNADLYPERFKDVLKNVQVSLKETGLYIELSKLNTYQYKVTCEVALDKIDAVLRKFQDYRDKKHQEYLNSTSKVNENISVEKKLSRVVSESVLMETGNDLTDEQKKYVEDMVAKDKEFYGFPSYDSENDFVEDVTIDFEEEEAINMYLYYKQLWEQEDQSIEEHVAIDTYDQLDKEEINPVVEAKPINESVLMETTGIIDEQYLIDLVGASFETGHGWTEDFNEFKTFIEEDLGPGIDLEVIENVYTKYQEMCELGPAGFYEEYKDRFDFSDDYISEYGEEEFEENLTFETQLKEHNRNEEPLSVRLKRRLSMMDSKMEDLQIESKEVDDYDDEYDFDYSNEYYDDEIDLFDEDLDLSNTFEEELPEEKVVEEVSNSVDESTFKYNIGSNKLIPIDSDEYSRLVELAKILTERSPNEYKYQVQQTYEDFGAGMQWYNIICYDRDGNDWQVLNTKDWLDLANGIIDIEEAYQRVIKGEYFQDKITGDVDSMNHRQLLNYMNSLDD